MKLAVLITVLLSTSSVYSASVDAASKCSSSECNISDNCRCSSMTSPLSSGKAPQLIGLTFDEAIVPDVFDNVWSPILFKRKNPDGRPISATFFVPHEYTDYTRVQDLYLRGFEIGVNSVTRNSLAQYWSNATEDTLTLEFDGQRTIISTFANIPVKDIVGGRTPQLQIEGDVSIDAYESSHLLYDSSWTTRSSTPLFPYTLDYLSTQECRTGTTCPKESHEGFWIVPIINLQGNSSVECNALTNCNFQGTTREITNWLLAQVDRHRSSTRSPLTLLVPSSWFRFTDNSYEAFTDFLDILETYDDVFLVNQHQIIDWVKNPVSLDDFATAQYDRSATCNPINCGLQNANGDLRYMNSCVSCPQVYPWLGNPLGKA